jgi:phosphatidylinositol-3-phosphatase
MLLRVRQHLTAIAALFLSLTMTIGCGTSTSNSTGPGPGNNSRINHVVVVVLENHSFSEVIGNSAVPYLNNLASTYGLATQYYGDTHPSIGNYFMLTTGQIITNSEVTPPARVSADNIVRELLANGKTWKSYAESLPSIGYLGTDVYPYAQHHNPFVFFSDVQSSAAQTSNIVPFTQFGADLTSGQLPNFSFVVPNQLHNAHDGSLNQADVWLSQNIAPLLSSSVFQKDGLLIVLFDESDFTDLTNVGGHTVAVVVSPFSKKSYQSTTFYQHQNTLRFVLSELGVNNYPGAAAAAQNMTEFLQ